MSLRVLDAGLQSLIVDMGRPGSRSLGVPVGGAADRWSLAIGNALVCNPPETPALEVTAPGPVLQAESRVAGVIFGAPFQAASDRQSISMGKTFTLEPGEILRIRGTPRGMRAYFCVPGGFDAPAILGSRSAWIAIASDQLLPCISSSLPGRYPRHAMTPSVPGAFPVVLRVLPGTQSDWFAPGELEKRQFTVTPTSNRMGLRIKSEPIPRPAREMVSEPVCPGTVEVTNDGQCIVLGIDGQTIGGYPKIAQVISADVDVLGQLRPGDTLQFCQVAQSHAEQEFLKRDAELRRQLASLALAVS